MATEREKEIRRRRRQENKNNRKRAKQIDAKQASNDVECEKCACQRYSIDCFFLSDFLLYLLLLPLSPFWFLSTCSLWLTCFRDFLWFILESDSVYGMFLLLFGFPNTYILSLNLLFLFSFSFIHFFAFWMYILFLSPSPSYSRIRLELFRIKFSIFTRCIQCKQWRRAVA